MTSGARHVVAVAGPVGGGKSTLVQGLSGRLPDCSAVHFDHYETVTAQPIDAIRRWLEEGAEVEAIALPELERHLGALKAGQSVTDPATRLLVPARRFILFETQFGRRHAATGKHIDFLIWIDTPLDIALARKLREFTAPLAALGPSEHAAFVSWLREYLGNYLEVVAGLLRMQRDTVAGQADLVIDGQADPQDVILSAERAILSRFG